MKNNLVLQKGITKSHLHIYSTWLGVAETVLCTRFAGLGKTIPSMHCIMFPSFLGTKGLAPFIYTVKL